MAYTFSQEKSASFKFKDNTNKNVTLEGINGDLTSAAIIVEGVASLMAIGGINGTYLGAERRLTQNVNDE